MKYGLGLVILVLVLLATSLASQADRAKGYDVPFQGDGIRICVPYGPETYTISAEQPYWLSVTYFHPVYAGSIPDLKDAFNDRSIVGGMGQLEIRIDGRLLRRRDGVKQYTYFTPVPSWFERPPFISPEEWAHVDFKYRTLFMQLPPYYFEPGEHHVLLVGILRNPNNLDVKLGGDPVTEFSFTVIVEN